MKRYLFCMTAALISISCNQYTCKDFDFETGFLSEKKLSRIGAFKPDSGRLEDYKTLEDNCFYIESIDRFTGLTGSGVPLNPACYPALCKYVSMSLHDVFVPFIPPNGKRPTVHCPYGSVMAYLLIQAISPENSEEFLESGKEIDLNIMQLSGDDEDNLQKAQATAFKVISLLDRNGDYKDALKLARKEWNRLNR